ncbi:MAG: hypothetical protein K2W96_20750 [Gemmataceae bacterium]|nr:hypothetical protein [Gemmataceae bacterium]
MMPLILLVSVLGAAPPVPHLEPLPTGAIARLGSGRLRGILPGRAVLAPDASRLVVEDADGLALHDAEGRLVARLLVRRGAKLVAFSKDSKRVAYSSGTAVLVADAGTGKLLRQHECEPSRIALSTEGTRLAVWTEAPGKRSEVVEIATGNISPLLAFADMERLGFFDPPPGKRRIRWDDRGWLKAEGLGEVAMTRLPAGWVPEAVGFPARGGGVVMGRRGEALRLWDIVTGRELTIPAGHESPLASMAFSADGKTLLTAADGVRAWDTRSWKERPSLPGNRMAAVSSGGRRALVDDTVHELGRGAILLRPWRKPLALAMGDRAAAALSHDDGARQAELWAWDAAGKKLAAKEFFTAGLAQQALAMSPNDRRAAAILRDGSLVFAGLLDLRTRRTRELARLLPEASHLAFSPDGLELAVCSPGAVQLFDPVGLENERLPLPRGPHAAGWSGDGKLLAVGSEDEVRVIERVSLAVRHTFRLLPGSSPPTAFAFSPGNALLVSGHRDSSALVWDLASPAPRVLAEDADWLLLSSKDAAIAHAAMRRLASDPHTASALLDKRLPRRVQTDDDLRRMAVLVHAGDDGMAAKAEAVLRAAGRSAVPALHEEMTRVGVAAQRRLEVVRMELSDRFAPETLRQIRSVEVLERAGAREVLASLAKRLPDTRLGREAEKALARLQTAP